MQPPLKRVKELVRRRFSRAPGNLRLRRDRTWRLLGLDAVLGLHGKKVSKPTSNTLLVQKLMPSHPSPCKSLVSLSFSDPHDCVWAIDFHTNVTVKAPRLFETIDRAKFCEVPRSKLSLIDGFTSAILTTGLLCQVPMENYFNPSQTTV